MGRPRGKLKIPDLRRVAATLLLGSVLVGGTVGVVHQFGSEKDENNSKNPEGHSDFIPLPLLAPGKDEFVVLDVGNHWYDGVLFQDAKLKYCENNGIGCGIVITLDTSSLANVYEDVEYVKGLVSGYSISYPVYLNVDAMMKDTSLNNTAMTEYATAFLQKCSDNGMYVGVYGTDSNLCRFKKHTGIDSYDAFVVQDEEKVLYDGSYTILEDLDGNIRSSVDLENVINQNGNNTVDGFQYDKVHTVTEDEELLDIAFQYGLSADDILSFNGISEKDLTVGTEIRIPSALCDDIADSFAIAGSPLRGADLSYAQGDNINWEKMAENFEFLIFKCAEGTHIDSCFENNMAQAEVYDIPAGVYCYNAYDMTNTTSIEDFITKQKEQIDTVLQALQNKKVVYPVYLDIEIPSGATWNERFNAEYVSAMLNLWVEKVSQAGYTPGLYSNQYGLKNLQGLVNYPLEDHFELWVAGGDQYTSEKEDIPLEKVRPSSLLEENPAISMVQSTDSAVNSGAGNGKGHLDVNFSRKDYSKPAFDNRDGLLDVHDFGCPRPPAREVAIGIVGVASLAGVGIVAGKLKRSKTRQGKRMVRK